MKDMLKAFGHIALFMITVAASVAGGSFIIYEATTFGAGLSQDPATSAVCGVFFLSVSFVGVSMAIILVANRYRSSSFTKGKKGRGAAGS